MLRYLQIRDFAIIDAVELELKAGLTVLTGETGAGKSIIVDALELLSGARAAADVVRAGAERADIAATVDITETGGELRHILEEHSIESGGELLLRRVIGTDGRSRAWLNGQAVPLQVLASVTALLFEIHGQHEFQSLVRAATQRELVDGYGRLESLAAQVRAAHSVWLALLNRSIELDSAASERGSRLDLLRHQLHELQGLQLQAGEIAALKEERGRLANRGRLVEAARAALDCLYESDGDTAHTLIARAVGAMRQAIAMDPQLVSLGQLIDEAEIHVKDAGHGLLQYLDALDLDPQRADAIEQRLAALEELARKHRVTPEALIDKQAELAAQLQDLETAAADVGAVRAQLASAAASYQDLARQLSGRREAAARALAREISARMQELGMGGGRFLIDVAAAESAEPAAHGLDRIEFRVSTNPGQPPRAIAKVASGGELSRLSLAVQVSCAGSAAACMVFDEVDSGIGGAVAEIVGRELRSLGEHAQVLCVTHLPQVAAQAHQHLRVAKHSDARTTRTSVAMLSADERIDELARMLGGVEITPRARAHAKEMLAAVASAAAAAQASTAAAAKLGAAAPRAPRPRPAGGRG
ncbi:MAG: DNA repair protein RecN [Steroidobacteraceae bacterium]